MVHKKVNYIKQIKLSNGSINIEPSKKGLKISFPDFYKEFNSKIKILCNGEDVVSLISNLEPYATKEIKKEEKAYIEEVSTYINEVERTLNLTGCKGSLQINLNCYTDKQYDDNWIKLTPIKLSYFIGLLYGYIP